MVGGGGGGGGNKFLKNHTPLRYTRVCEKLIFTKIVVEE
jgi:hypothetical protein